MNPGPVALALTLLAAALPARADEAGDAWRRIAEIDSAAALELIEQNHPGARPEVGDMAFQARLDTARRHVAERLPRVASLAGYNALLMGLATDFGDGHIRTTAQVSQATVEWTGLLAQRRGGQWVIARDFNESATLEGAELLSCDGVAADTLAGERLGQFRADAAVEASMARVAWALLIDDGNPFLERPRECRFRLPSGGEAERALPWRSVPTQQMQQQFGQAISRPRAGMGVEPFAGGYWIALQTLDPSAEQVVDEVRALEAELRAAPMVVLDLRGNGGGNSDYASSIAAVLAGSEAMRAIGSVESDCAGAFWRSSSGNASAIRAQAEAAEGERREWLGAIATELEQAVAAGQEFSPPLPACARAAADAAQPAAAPPPLAMRGRLVLLTDRACFSSCLITADVWRRLGAIHVGEATDRSTRYMEVRDEVLPSGLRTFSTLMKLALGAGDFGPYEPDVPYAGALDDTTALQAWVAAIGEAG
jgi:hypothetical protein